MEAAGEPGAVQAAAAAGSLQGAEASAAAASASDGEVRVERPTG